MSFVKYRVKEVATDFGKTPKEIADIISKYSEKPKSNTQVLTEAELNALFDDITRNNQIKSLEAKGYVNRSRSKSDERVLNVELTETGEALKERAVKIPGCLMEMMPLNQEEAGELYRLLHKILSADE